MYMYQHTCTYIHTHEPKLDTQLPTCAPTYTPSASYLRVSMLNTSWKARRGRRSHSCMVKLGGSRHSPPLRCESLVPLHSHVSPPLRCESLVPLRSLVALNQRLSDYRGALMTLSIPVLCASVISVCRTRLPYMGCIVCTVLTLYSAPILNEHVTPADLAIEVMELCKVKATRCTCCLSWAEPEQRHGIVSSNVVYVATNECVLRVPVYVVTSITGSVPAGYIDFTGNVCHHNGLYA